MKAPELIQSLMALITLCLIAAVSVFGIQDCGQQRRCTSAGGRVERYNEETMLVPMSCGDGCTMLSAETTSDWRCVGAPAERSP